MKIILGILMSSSLLVSAFAGCNGENHKEKTEKASQQARNRFSDTVLQKIHDLKDRRNTEALMNMADLSEEAYHREIALALASVQDKKAVPVLLELLGDPGSGVREVAAFALGQLRDTALEKELISSYQGEIVPRVQAVLLESVGKCATEKGLHFLASLQGGKLIKEGQAWGIYRAGQKELYTKKSIQKAVELLNTKNNSSVRLAAAHYLAGTKEADLSPSYNILYNAAKKDPSPFVRMKALRALSKTGKEGLNKKIGRSIVHDPDPRVRISGFEALGETDYQNYMTLAWEVLDDRNVKIQIAGAEFLKDHLTSTKENIQKLLNKSGGGLNWRARSILLSAIMELTGKPGQLVTSLKYTYSNSYRPYVKASLLRVMAGTWEAFPYVKREIMNAAQPVIASSGMAGLVSLVQGGQVPKHHLPVFRGFLKQALASQNTSLVAQTANILRDTALDLHREFTQKGLLTKARKELSFPGDYEAIAAIEKTLAEWQGREYVPPEIPYNNPIDWELLTTLPPEGKVSVETNKGKFIMKLFVEEAPGTVAQFLSLVKEGFYEGKYFHRLVPNFVVQGGGPKGDGWGTLDRSIRSEFTTGHYYEGFVGMASAGKDTESCQWFITLSPAPHLDGRYTRFAKISDGMKVIRELQPGDKIVKIKVLENEKKEKKTGRE